MQWEIFIHTTEARNKVILKRSYGTFGGIAAMNAGWYKLKIDVVVR
jgi:hypothetical protein